MLNRPLRVTIGRRNNRIYKIKFVRKLFLPFFHWLNIGDIQIKHHYTGTKFHLHSFKHRQYWYHKKNREKNLMDLFSILIKSGDVVIEAGSHVGYISAYFSQLVGSAGHVYAFEPGDNNLPYIRANLADRANTTLIIKAVSDVTVMLPFYVEELSGQNNSLVGDYDDLSETRKIRPGSRDIKQ